MQPLATLALFLVSLVYSSVGHGGASGYLAVLALMGAPPGSAAVSALGLNLLVSGLAFVSFARARHFSWKLAAPFAAASVPAAFLGGLVRLPAGLYGALLGLALFFAGLRLALPAPASAAAPSSPPTGISLAAGAFLGFVSGAIGIGGGVFLSPLLILMGWAGPKETSAASAFFIFANSAAALFARSLTGLRFDPGFFGMILAAFAGGLFGSRFGAGKCPPLGLRRLLALVLFFASYKLIRL